jgi:Tat protein translocase TatB subunit
MLLHFLGTVKPEQPFVNEELTLDAHATLSSTLKTTLICDTLAPMFNIGFPELLLILAVALLVVGPSKLPELARSIGKAFGQFKRVADDVRDTIDQEAAEEKTEEIEEEKEEKREIPPQGEESKSHEPPKP